MPIPTQCKFLSLVTALCTFFQASRSSVGTGAARLETHLLAELRRARGLTQTQVAASLAIEQGAVSRLERRDDLFLSTLSDYIQALGGELRLVASFPDGDIPLSRPQLLR